MTLIHSSQNSAKNELLVVQSYFNLLDRLDSLITILPSLATTSFIRRSIFVTILSFSLCSFSGRSAHWSSSFVSQTKGKTNIRFTKPASYFCDVNPKFVAKTNLNLAIISLADLYFASPETLPSPVTRFMTPRDFEDNTFSSISRHDIRSLSSQSPKANLPPSLEESILDIREPSNRLSKNCPNNTDFPEFEAFPATTNFLHLFGNSNIPRAYSIIRIDVSSPPVASLKSLSKFGVHNSISIFSFRYLAFI